MTGSHKLNVQFILNEFDCKGSDLLWFMQMKERKILIFLLHFGNGVENAVAVDTRIQILIGAKPI